MRIVYLHQYFITPQMVGGSRSYEMARRLVAAGHEVHMVTSDQGANSSRGDWRTSTVAGIQVHWTPVPYNNVMENWQRIRAFLVFAWRAARRAAHLDGDVIFATSTPLTIAIPAVLASRWSRKPLVFEVRDLWPAVPIAIGALRNPVLRFVAKRLEKFAYRNSSHIVALAPGMRDEIVSTGYPAEKVSVIPNGCDLDVFSSTNNVKDIRDNNVWLGNSRIVLFAGTFGLVNGMEYLVRLAVAMDQIGADVRIVAIGTGRTYESTVDLAKQSGVYQKNLYFLGQLPKVDAAKWVAAADMTIALFTGPEIVWRDAVQNKFFDSLAAGTPVINNFEGWQSKIAEAAGAGIIVSADDPIGAAEKIVSTVANRDWMNRARDSARRLAVERFSRDDLAADLAGVLGRVYSESTGVQANKN